MDFMSISSADQGTSTAAARPHVTKYLFVHTPRMARKDTRHVSETPATAWLRGRGIDFSEHVYDYVEHGGTAESAQQLGVEEHAVVKTLVMQDERARPLVVLMHGDRQVSTKSLARAIGCKSVEPCRPEVAQRHSGYQVGGTSPFGFKREGVPVYVQASVLPLSRIYINGGRRGYLVGIEPRLLSDVLGAVAVECAVPPAATLTGCGQNMVSPDVAPPAGIEPASSA
jgi:Cys-tRNA(Pro) deacylase